MVVILVWLEEELLEAQVNLRLLSVSAQVHNWHIALDNKCNTSPQKADVMLLKSFQAAGFESKALKEL